MDPVSSPLPFRQAVSSSTPKQSSIDPNPGDDEKGDLIEVKEVIDDDDPDGDPGSFEPEVRILHQTGPVTYPSLQNRVSWIEASKPVNRIELGQVGGGGGIDSVSVSEEDFDSGEDHDEFFSVPRYTGVMEWLACLLLDCAILVLEVGFNLWMASKLHDVNHVAPYNAVPVLLIVPSLVNAVLWLRLKESFSSFGKVFVLLVVVLGFPSPFFLYIWHLYLSTFGRRHDAERSKNLANIFHMAQAIAVSVPLIFINLTTLMNVFRVPGEEHVAFDIGRLTAHTGEVTMHGLAFIVSFTNLIRATSTFSERQTFTVLFVTVALPFIFLTTLTRLISLSILIEFLKPEWTAVLLLGCVMLNWGAYVTCRKRGGTKPRQALKALSDSFKVSRGYLRPVAGFIEERPSTSNWVNDQDRANSSGCGCCGPSLSSTRSHRTRTYEINHYDDDDDKFAYNGTCKKNALALTSEGTVSSDSSTGSTGSVWLEVPKLLLMSIASVFVPVAYTNDTKCFHPRLKGGLFLSVNFLISSVLLGSSLGYAILHHIPNTFRGLSLPQPAVKVVVPSSKLMIKTAGMDVSLDLPNSNVDLGSMPSTSANINTDNLDPLFAIVVPVMLAFIVLPFLIMRVSMMELDCFVSRRKALADLEQIQNKRRGRRQKHRQEGPTRNPSSSVKRIARRDRQSEQYQPSYLVDTVARNIESKELRARLSLTLCCGVLAVIIMTFVFMATGVFLYLSLM